MFEKIKSFADSSLTIGEARKNPQDWSTLKEVAVFIALFILMFLVNGLFEFFFEVMFTDEYQFVYLFSFIIIPFIIAFYVVKIEKRSLRSIGLTKKKNIKFALTGLLIGFVMLCSVVGIGVISGQYVFRGVDPSLPFYVIVMFFIGYFIQSFSEEIYTRGWTLTYFSKKHSVVLSIIICNIVFVLVHLANPGLDIIAVINIFLVGVVFSILFLRFDNLLVNGAAHAAWNFTQGTILGFSVSSIQAPSLLHFEIVNPSIIAGGSFGPESSLIATFVIIISLFIALYYPKKSKNSD